jgi:hypothetical protein
MTMTSQGSESGGAHLTGPGKFLLFVVGLAVLGYAGWTYRDQLPIRFPGSGQTTSTAPTTTTPATPAPAAQQHKGVLGRIKDGFDFRLAAIIAEGLGTSTSASA